MKEDQTTDISTFGNTRDGFRRFAALPQRPSSEQDNSVTAIASWAMFDALEKPLRLPKGTRAFSLHCDLDGAVYVRCEYLCPDSPELQRILSQAETEKESRGS